MNGRFVALTLKNNEADYDPSECCQEREKSFDELLNVVSAAASCNALQQAHADPIDQTNNNNGSYDRQNNFVGPVEPPWELKLGFRQKKNRNNSERKD